MTKGDILIQIISEAYDVSPETVTAFFERDFAILGRRGNHDEDVSDAEATRLLAGLRNDIDAVRRHYGDGFLAYMAAVKKSSTN